MKPYLRVDDIETCPVPPPAEASSHYLADPEPDPRARHAVAFWVAVAVACIAAVLLVWIFNERPHGITGRWI